jgi:hypothetical protein
VPGHWSTAFLHTDSNVDPERAARARIHPCWVAAMRSLSTCKCKRKNGLGAPPGSLFHSKVVRNGSNLVAESNEYAAITRDLRLHKTARLSGGYIKSRVASAAPRTFPSLTMFTVKATYRAETRKLSFKSPFFPTYDELCREVCCSCDVASLPPLSLHPSYIVFSP